MTPLALAHKATERDCLRSWRLDQLVRVGYPPWDALVLSRRDDIDLRAAVSLLDRGCPPETAMRILL